MSSCMLFFPSVTQRLCSVVSRLLLARVMGMSPLGLTSTPKTPSQQRLHQNLQQQKCAKATPEHKAGHSPHSYPLLPSHCFCHNHQRPVQRPERVISHQSSSGDDIPGRPLYRPFCRSPQTRRYPLFHDPTTAYKTTSCQESAINTMIPSSFAGDCDRNQPPRNQSASQQPQSQ